MGANIETCPTGKKIYVLLGQPHSKERMRNPASKQNACLTDALAYWLKINELGILRMLGEMHVHSKGCRTPKNIVMQFPGIGSRLEIHERLKLHEPGSWEEEIQVTRDIIIK